MQAMPTIARLISDAAPMAAWPHSATSSRSMQFDSAVHPIHNNMMNSREMIFVYPNAPVRAKLIGKDDLRRQAIQS
jgi:hypothetical protein